MNEKLKESSEGRVLESQARLNIALCKFNQKDYEIAIDQCERVLDKDPKNAKACFRMAQSVFNKYGQMKDLTDAGARSNARLVFNYAKKASDLLPADAKIKEFFNQAKDIN
jgi:tetratricopeptide (TPR) repeat protein